MRRLRRRRVLCDLQIQGGLCVRLAFYWAGCLLIVTTALALSTINSSPATSGFEFAIWFWNQYGPIIVMPLLALPIAILDCMITTNRHVGPLLRVRRSLKQMAQGQEVHPIKIRSGDLLQDMVDDLNILVERMEEQKGEAGPRSSRPAQLAEVTERDASSASKLAQPNIVSATV